MRKLAAFSFAFAFAVLISQYLLPVYWQLIAGIGAFVLGFVGFFFNGSRRRRVFLILFGICAGLIWNYGYETVVYSSASKLNGTTQSVEAEVIDFPLETDYGAEVDVRICIDGAPDIKTAAYVFSDELNDCRPGDRIIFTADFSLADEVNGQRITSYVSKGYFLFAGNVEVQEHLSSSGLQFKYLHRYAAKAVKEMIDRLFPMGTAGFMRALLTGDKILIDEDESLSNAMARSGVSHIITVSGMHVSILAGFILFLTGRKKRSLFVVTPVLLIFMGISGFSASVVRAVIMQMFVLCAPLINRENDSLTALSAALLVILLFNPYAVMGVGLQLSFAATLGIILFTPGLNKFFSDHLKKIKGAGKVRRSLRKLVFGGLSTTFGALILTTPLSAIYFGYISLVAPLVNLLILWAVTPAFAIGVTAVVCGFIFLPVASVIAWGAALLVKFIVFVVTLFSKPYFAAIYLGSFVLIVWFVCVYFGIVLYIALKATPRQLIIPASAAVVALCAILVVNAVNNDSKVGYSLTALNVGQGQCLVLTSGEYTAVIDCGSSSGEDAGELAERYIRGLGRDRIDLLLLTHYHSDHANGVDSLLSCMDVSALIVPEPEYDDSTLDEEIISLATDAGTDIIYVDDDMLAHLGDTDIYLYAPLGSDSENERGVCMLITQNNFDILVTGDVDTSTELQLVGKERLPDIECLIVGHHGSKYSTSQTLLDAVMPEAAVISVGENSYGHPTQEVLSRLADNGITIYRTDVSGNITINSDFSE